MNVKGLIRLEFVNQETGEVRIEERENFIHRERYNTLLLNSNAEEIAIFPTEEEIFPMFSREGNYYSTESYLKGTNKTKKFYPKTTESPPYVEFYSLFLPDQKTRYIQAISIIGSNYDAVRYTAINLLPACEQQPTEYLNIYYRIVLHEEAEDVENNDWVKSKFVEGIITGSGDRTFVLPSNIWSYSFRIEEDLSKSGHVNFLQKGNISHAIENRSNSMTSLALNNSLRYTDRYYAYPQNAPNQYQQNVGGFMNTVIRFGGNNTNLGIQPFKYIKDIGPQNSGIGNVFGTSSLSDTPLFDPTNFTVGSGRMFATGQWEVRKVIGASKFVVTIAKTGSTLSEGAYKVNEYHRTPEDSLVLYSFSDARKQEQYKDPSRIHKDTQSHPLRKFIEDRAFISCDDTGITIYDIYHGRLYSFDALSSPSLPVTDLRDVKVAPDGTIWIACANTGLWKLEADIDAKTYELTEIGAPPGCQSKVYAIDIDSFGNVFGIWWGLGLHYSTDGGSSWVNAIINYAQFSEMDEGGLNSKWRFCTKLVCNPHKNAALGNAQLLLLQSSKTAGTAGCWYDQISATTTGITNSTLASKLGMVRDMPWRDCMVVTKRTERWVFSPASRSYNHRSFSNKITNGNTLGNSGFAESIPFQHNRSDTTVYFNWDESRNVDPSDCSGNLEYMDLWSEAEGKFKDYVVVSIEYRSGSRKEQYSHVYDVEYGHSIWSDRSSYADVNYRFTEAWGSVRIGRNILVTNSRDGWSVIEEVPPAKENRTYTSTLWGWGGGQWKANHPGIRPTHGTEEDFIKGVRLKFQDGPTGSTSWNATDQYTFTCFDGYYKDNSSKIWVKDTIYTKPRDIVTTFNPPTVSLYDRTNDVGILNNPTIAVDWDIRNFPDASYDGSPIITDGDSDYGFVQTLVDFKTLEDKSRLKATPENIGDLQPDGTVKIRWANGEEDATTHFNGEQCLKFPSPSNNPLGNNPLTLECWVYPTEKSDSHQVIIDLRGSSDTHNGVLLVGPDMKPYWYSNRSSFTASDPLPINAWTHVAVSRTGSKWEMALNGRVKVSWDMALSFTSPIPINIGRRYAAQNFWYGRFASAVVGDIKNPFNQDGGVFGLRQDQTSSTGGVGKQTVVYQKGTGYKTLSVYAKKAANPAMRISFQLGNAQRSVWFNFQTNLFFHKTGVGNDNVEVLTDGWVRLSVTVPSDHDGSQGTFEIGTFGSESDYNTSTQSSTSIGTYIFGVMINDGETAKPYTNAIDPVNLVGDGSDRLTDTFSGFRGNLSNFRLTARTDRYVGNFPPPAEPFKAYTNDYSGARVKFSSAHHQGSIVSKKELVGDWTVVFRDIDPEMFKLRRQRPSIVWGITSTPSVQDLTDIGYRFVPVGSDTMRFQRFGHTYGSGQSMGSSVNEVRFTKVGDMITVEYKTSTNGTFQRLVDPIQDFAPIHYIAFWQESPSLDDATSPNHSPSVIIEKNGAAWCSKVGDITMGTGVYRQKFLAIDTYWQESFEMELGGVPSTNNRSNYQNEAAPLEGECYAHQHGTVRFHPNDAGKVITGKFIALHD